MIANGTPEEQAAFQTAVTQTYLRLVMDDHLVALTPPSAEFYPQVTALGLELPGIKWKLEGDMLLASVQSAGVVVNVSNGQYRLGIDPTSSTFTAYDSGGQPLQNSNNLYDLRSYLTSSDAAGLPYTSGAIDANGNLVNYSTSRLSQINQGGNSAASALGTAETDAFVGPAPRYYVHQFGNIRIVVKENIFGHTISDTTKPFDTWIPSTAPSGATLVQRDTYKRTNTFVVASFTVTLTTTGTQEIWRK